MDEMIRFSRQSMRLEDVGGKAAALHALRGLPIPEWFVLTPAAFTASGCMESDPSRWRVSEALRVQLDQALEQLSEEGGCFAVRSSAIDEDGQGFSFAGQLDSFLGVAETEVADRVADVWRSAFSEHIRAYRAEHGLGACVPPAVVVQRMIDAQCAGVSFAVDPITGNWDHALVSSVWGLGSSLVDGELDGDTYRVDRSGRIVEKQAGPKPFGMYLRDRVPQKQEHDRERAGAYSLDDRVAAEIAALARLCSQRRGCPQDIEWAYEKGRLYLLQSRPITSLGRVPDPGGKLNIWDNSNIAESYGGVTTPLTYSFARSIYEEVYRQFCKIMGVPRHVIEANRETYRGLLGLMHGRMYYNLINWYRLLACFPGFSINRGFMEQMMGVRKELGEELLQLIPRPRANRLLSLVYLGKALAGMGLSYLLLPRKIKRFYTRLDIALARPEIPLSAQRADELVALYRQLEDRLLLRWDAPLINDFFAMIAFGMLSKLCRSWCGDGHGTMQNDLVGGSGRVVSAEPAKRVAELAACIRGDREAMALFQRGADADILAYLDGNETMGRLFRQYLERFGDRCIDELKLESVPLHDDPLPLLRAIGHFAAREERQGGGQAVDARLEAERRALEILSQSSLRRQVFTFILKHARARVEDRENLRFERTRLFGRVREIMVELGKRFAALGVLKDHNEIFYLEKDEILGFVEGFASCPDLGAIAAVRKCRFQDYAALPPIADRFQTRGMVFVGNDFSVTDGERQPLADEQGQRQGIGCCPGIVRGRVRVVRDPRGVELPAGAILVAERTDPGWIMLFPAAAGLLVERGSLLSHSAIVARELGLPAVVSVPGVTSWLQNGDLVELDGGTGLVQLLQEEDHV
ncbi:PEP/pyruvate-binding domain-containing protein [Desulfobulbus sp.]|uniref:PEP/pyruvate-binding domain-containing protein n=1 Tax=Desulfobulbus sp. TaxID=895 RepID=UPI00286F7AFD|nr:PEP/pyruvate-binding domain-containing protein [Desulfobulbus sp.]